MMKFSTLINGYDSFNLTKLDILDDFDEIKVGVKYTYKGKELEGFPGTSFLSDCWSSQELISPSSS